MLLKSTISFILCFLLVYAIWDYNQLKYLFVQGQGQAEVVLNIRSIDEALNDEDMPEAKKNKLRQIEEIKSYAEDSLGLEKTGSYTTYYDQKGEPVIWLLKACPPFELTPYEWSFPFAGSFSYKGFFDKKDAIKEQQELIKSGYDTRIGIVSAWSTLGILNDPVMSSMLNRSEGELANLIFHELTHATIFVKNNVQLNENIASFVGETGAEEYLSDKYGSKSEQLLHYRHKKSDYDTYSKHILRGAYKLDSLYESMSDEMSFENKCLMKKNLIADIINSADTLTFYHPDRYSFLKKKDFKPNNAYFIGYMLYRKDLSKYQRQYQNMFKDNLRTYIEYLKTIHSS
jgi:predicted aminopeptidase